MSKTIMGIQLQQRHDTSTDVQSLLTKYGCAIKTRIGVHEAPSDSCSEQGIIIVEFVDNAVKEVQEMEQALSNIEGVIVRKMEF